jgi:predicted ATPase
MRQLRGLLDDHRLVTITGVGGVGKTRLSIEVAADVLVSFKDGAWIVELAAADAESMHAIFAAALGARLRPGSTVREDVIEFLARRDLPLLVDNVEHLADVATFVERLGAGARCAGGARHEPRKPLAWSVPDLAGAIAGGGGLGSSLESVSATASAVCSSIACLAMPISISIRATPRPVVEICRRLDGIPLAIEPAAARRLLQPLRSAGCSTSGSGC